MITIFRGNSAVACVNMDYVEGVIKDDSCHRHYIYIQFVHSENNIKIDFENEEERDKEFSRFVNY